MKTAAGHRERGAGLRQFWIIAALTALAACAAPQRPAPPVAPVALPPSVSRPAIPALSTDTARASALAPVALAELPGWADSDHAKALAAFRKSCRVVTRRADASELTTPEDWAAPCADAATATDARAFFERAFAGVAVAAGTGLNTGYFEPEIAGSRTASPAFPFPIYKRPADLVEVDLGQFADSLKGRRIRGRVEGAALVPYWDRAQIEDGALAGRGLEIGWAADPYHLFFLHIQGSGRLKLPDGQVMRIGYDGQNGRDYTGIGKLLRERNLLAPGQATMDGIIAWMRANPDAGRALMRENRSYIFLKELTGDGPLGSMNVALTPEYSLAADPKFVPQGAPVWLDTMIPEPDTTPKGFTQTSFRRLMVAQDTGGAIKGPNRFDLFWGPGDRAAKVAGGMSWQGRAVILLPKAAAARLTQDARP